MKLSLYHKEIENYDIEDSNFVIKVIRYAEEHAAGLMSANCGFICISTYDVVLHLFSNKI